ncbi:MAG: hypothetical protein V2J89_02405 [Halieaceae bacterium]|jgi:hypothetical protein|nr:hypothetical protein [Halieaceae bacterium]
MNTTVSTELCGPALAGDFRPLTADECALVAGGRSTFGHAMDGFNNGIALGTVSGAALTGATLGATRWGVIGGALGFSWGLGWGVGVSLRWFVYRR